MKYIAYWDCLGFEFIKSISSYERDCLLKDIANQPHSKPPINYAAALIRAQANPQRNPEIWIFESDVDEECLQQYAEEIPQELANMIRKYGSCMYSRPTEKTIIE